MKINILVFLIGLALSSCSSSNQSSNTQNNNLPKSSANEFSKLEVLIPNGWNKIDDNFEKIFDVWLVNKTKNASIGFIPINFDSAKTYNTQDDILKFLIRISLSNRKFPSGNFEMISESNYDMGFPNKEVRFRIDNSIQNLIIFGKNKTYFECLAYFKENYTPTGQEFENLIETQKKVLRNLKIN